MEKSKVEKPSSKIYFSKEKEDAGALKGVKAVAQYARKAPAKTPKKSETIKVIKLPRAYKPLRALDIDPATGMPTLEEYVQAPHLLKGALPETQAQYQKMLRERARKQAELTEAQLKSIKRVRAKKETAPQVPMTPARPQSPGVELPPPESTVTDLRVFARQKGINIPSSITKKADIRAYIESQMGAGESMSIPPPEFEEEASQFVEKSAGPEASESGIGTASGKGLKFKGRPRKEMAEVMAGKDVEKHFKKFKALMKKEAAGSLTPIQTKKLQSYKQLQAGGFFDTVAKIAKPLIKKGIEYAMENPDKILEFGTKYGPVAFEYLGKKKRDIFG